MREFAQRGFAASLFIVFLSILPAPGAQAAEQATAAALAATCAGCHGTDGNSVGPASPSIAGTSEEYFIKAMNAYQNGRRNSTIMKRIAKGYTAGEISAMAGYFAGVKMAAAAQAVDAERVETGEILHQTFCEMCHMKGGTVPEDVGVLAGQWAPYLRMSITDIRAGLRGAPMRMRQRLAMMINRHDETAIDALIQYYGSQK